MADARKHLAKPMAELLVPGEELLGGCRAAGKNGIAKGVAGGAIGGAVGGAIAGAMSGSGTSGGAGGAVPQDRVFWVGATNQRLVYFGTGALSGKPKNLRGETPLDAVASVSVSGKMATKRMRLEFKDGSSATVDLYRSSSPDSLTAALEQVLPGRVVEGD